MTIIGVDPGPVTGIVVLWPSPYKPGASQVTEQVLEAVLWGLTDDIGCIAAEKFVIGRRSARSNDAKAGEVTRATFEEVKRIAQYRGQQFIARSASEVKPWATDERLKAWPGGDLLEITKGMRHARDAARHALFCAVKDFGQPDPLSKKARA